MQAQIVSGDSERSTPTAYAATSRIQPYFGLYKDNYFISGLL